jgi:hypothetical protein
MRKRLIEPTDPLDPPPAAGQCCAHRDCLADGEYRAPKSRDRLNEYIWFCLEHVRDYNKSWNYYEGMDSDTIELHIRQDTVWQRPSWPMGQWGALGGARASIHDGFGFFHEPSGARERRPEPRTPEERALATLDLEMPVTLAEIKIRYKILAKQLHPDANGGDKAAEERLKHINLAYSTLKNSAMF